MKTFESFNPRQDSVYDIGGGVVPEMAEVFGHDLSPKPDVENLGELIGKIGPAKTLQDNIGQVQEVLGTGDSAVEIAAGWVERSGLLTPVERHYMHENIEVPEAFDAAIITGGVRNWMVRRANVLQEAFEAGKQANEILLVGGNRVMNTSEGDDVAEGMTEADYLEAIVKPMLSGLGSAALVEVVSVDSNVGDEVMQAAADATDAQKILVASNAGAWVQNAGQFRRAMLKRNGMVAVYAKSDSFPVALHGEPPKTHQNPFTALGQIARNAQELTRHK